VTSVKDLANDESFGTDSDAHRLSQYTLNGPKVIVFYVYCRVQAATYCLLPGTSEIAQTAKRSAEGISLQTVILHGLRVLSRAAISQVSPFSFSRERSKRFSFDQYLALDFYTAHFVLLPIFSWDQVLGCDYRIAACTQSMQFLLQGSLCIECI
jgi:hypothetical protein